MTTIILGIAGPALGLIGVILGIRFAQKSWRQGQTADRYNKAIDQLASEKIDMRIAGIYTLERVASESIREQLTILKVLAAFIREYSREERLHTPSVGRSVAADIKIAMAVIGQRSGNYNNSEIDLRNTYLRGVELPGANLALADLTGADLTDADLFGAFLSTVRLIDADLSNSNLRRADLRKANLIRARLLSAQLDDACLAGAYLTSAHVTNASLVRVDCSFACLAGANLVNANLTDANFSGADLSHANLTGASLHNTSFIRADLTQAIFPSANHVPEGWSYDIQSGRVEQTN